MAKYKLRCCMEQANSTTLNDANSVSVLWLAIRAQLHGLHPRLASASEDVEFILDQEDIMNSTAEGLNTQYIETDPTATEKRAQWLQALGEWTLEMFDESPHTVALTGLLDYMIRNARWQACHHLTVPQYLDIIAVLMKNTEYIID